MSAHQLLLWYAVRDTLFGQNFKKQDVKKALELAAACEHEDARWLSDFCRRKGANEGWQLRRDFLKEVNDVRALCFGAAWVGDEELMRQSADMGYAFAQAWMASRTRGEESLEWARRAAKQGERDGFRRLGTQEGYLRAMELGCVESMCAYATMLPATDPQRFVWLGRAAALGASFRFREEFPRQVALSSTAQWCLSLAARSLVTSIPRKTVCLASGTSCPLLLAMQDKRLRFSKRNLSPLDERWMHGRWSEFA
jgi:hypothetical protein